MLPSVHHRLDVLCCCLRFNCLVERNPIVHVPLRFSSRPLAVLMCVTSTSNYAIYQLYGVRHTMIWVNAPCNRRVAALPYLWSTQYIWSTRTLFLDLSLLQKTRLRCKKTAGGRVRCKWSVGGTYELVPTSRLCSGEVTTGPKPWLCGDLHTECREHVI